MLLCFAWVIKDTFPSVPHDYLPCQVQIFASRLVYVHHRIKARLYEFLCVFVF